ncbi:MAG: hypothetical protein IPG77_00510 [Betaproteobacteria bacterium]|nr:hypothetical protein [Betaproteobacteria bacterium]
MRVRFAGAPCRRFFALLPWGRLIVPAAAVLRRGELTAAVRRDSRFVLKAVRLARAEVTSKCWPA